jgi:hypothetical protein
VRDIGNMGTMVQRTVYDVTGESWIMASIYTCRNRSYAAIQPPISRIPPGRNWFCAVACCWEAAHMVRKLYLRGCAVNCLVSSAVPTPGEQIYRL